VNEPKQYLNKYKMRLVIMTGRIFRNIIFYISYIIININFYIKHISVVLFYIKKTNENCKESDSMVYNLFRLIGNKGQKSSNRKQHISGK